MHGTAISYFKTTLVSLLFILFNFLFTMMQPILSKLAELLSKGVSVNEITQAATNSGWQVCMREGFFMILYDMDSIL